MDSCDLSRFTARYDIFPQDGRFQWEEINVAFLRESSGFPPHERERIRALMANDEVRSRFDALRRAVVQMDHPESLDSKRFSAICSRCHFTNVPLSFRWDDSRVTRDLVGEMVAFASVSGVIQNGDLLPDDRDAVVRYLLQVEADPSLPVFREEETRKEEENADDDGRKDGGLKSNSGLKSLMSGILQLWNNLLRDFPKEICGEAVDFNQQSRSCPPYVIDPLNKIRIMGLAREIALNAQKITHHSPPHHSDDLFVYHSFALNMEDKSWRLMWAVYSDQWTDAYNWLIAIQTQMSGAHVVFQQGREP